MSASLRPGVTAGIVGYTLGYLSFQLELFPFRSSAALGSSAPIKSTKFLKQVKVVGYSVLGSRLENGKFINVVGAPQAGTALVDPAGLPYVSGKYPPGKAGAASKAIYSWVGLRDAAKFPDAVSAAITKPGDAKAHTYGGGQSDAMSGAEVSAGKSVVHVVGPDFRSRPHTDAEALASLTRAYGNVLREIATLPASVPRVRLLPISGGVFLGGFKPDLTHMTMKALALGYETLTPAEQRVVLEKELEMCIFLDTELKPFKRAHAFAIANA